MKQIYVTEKVKKIHISLVSFNNQYEIIAAFEHKLKSPHHSQNRKCITLKWLFVFPVKELSFSLKIIQNVINY